MQISVPSAWSVFYAGGNWCDFSGGSGPVYIATTAEPMPTCAQDTANAVFVRPIDHGDLALESPPAHYVNGLLVWDLGAIQSLPAGPTWCLALAS